MAEMDDTEKRSIFKDEHLHIQSVIETFDGRMISIKTWSVTFSLTAMAGAFAADAPEAFLIASFSAAMFWLTEGHWKTFQYAYYDRAGKLEKFFAGEKKNLVPMQIGASWYEHWQKGGIKRLLRIMFWPHVYLPHVAVIVLGIVLYVLSATGHMAV